ncbi:MAG: hypothetical protein AABY53_02640 [Bdellovibrionota bacterium]
MVYIFQRYLSNCLLISLIFASIGCAHLNSSNNYKTAREYSKSKEFKPGKLVIVQGPTSSSETNINILAPVLKKYLYVIKDEQGKIFDAELYETVHTAPLHWKVDKIFVKGLSPGKKYLLEIVDEFRGSQTKVDQRSFSTLDTQKNHVRFAYASCMADDYRFNDVIDPMWEQMRKQNTDMIILNGDLVYVDSFEFVERKKATELDIWFRFIDAFHRLPVYHWQDIKPIFATWDDHDFGTNDGNRDFKEKIAAKKIFLAFFGGKNLSDSYQLEPDSIYSAFTGFKQKMLFLDNRYFRQPNKDQVTPEPYGHWGEKQHHWILNHLNDSNTPVWIFNGNQIFSGTDLSFKEAMQTNHPEHYKIFMEDMKKTKSPIIFASGDIHFSEIMQIPIERLNFQTYEVTSSAMHSYAGEGWENPLRLPGAIAKEYNFLIIDSKNDKGSLKVDVESWGLNNKPYFKKKLEVVRPI